MRDCFDKNVFEVSFLQTSTDSVSNVRLSDSDSKYFFYIENFFEYLKKIEVSSRILDLYDEFLKKPNLYDGKST
jgi:hypothetical protein